jgi:hypothetical protein
MEINNKNLGNKQLRKIALLMTKASDLGMNLSSYGEVGENDRSGNVYLWLEDYPFTLFIDLGSDDIQACWNSAMTDREEIIEVGKKCLFELESWAYKLENEDQQTEEEEA